MSFGTAGSAAARTSGTPEDGDEEMLTVKHCLSNGDEVVKEGALTVSRLAEPVRTLDGEIDCDRGVRARWDDGTETHYGNSGESSSDIHQETIYVMNRFGATVATYRL